MSVLNYDRAVLHPIETLATLLTSYRAEAVELAVIPQRGDRVTGNGSAGVTPRRSPKLMA